VTATLEDTLGRTSLYAEVAREGAILLAIFGPIATLEIIHALPWKYALAIWGLAIIMLVLGVELEVHVRRKQRQLHPIQADFPQDYYI
jgi:hypothetical protein